MKTTKNYPTSVAARIAGEDIQPNDFITILNEVVELPSYLWNCSGGAFSIDELVRIRYMPEEAGQPLKVFAICLPFVYGKSPSGGTAVVDTRRQQVVRLDPVNGRAIWKELRPASRKKRKAK